MALAVCAAAWTGAASAAPPGSHSPSSATRTAIDAAIHGDRALGSPSTYHVVDIRVASGNQYASANTAPVDPTTHQGALVILHSSHGRWRVIQFGSSDLGCGLPRAIQKDLDVTPPPGSCAQAG
jgi:hypothetical protein